jgi:hypothetical protein
MPILDPTARAISPLEMIVNELQIAIARDHRRQTNTASSTGL